MSDHLPLVQLFVEGKIQNRFVEMTLEIRKFIDIVSPELAKVQNQVSTFEQSRVGNVTEQQVESTMREDEESARRFLSTYNRMFGFVDHRLAMMSSNFTLADFLRESLRTETISSELLADFQYDLREYWEKSYGPLFEKFGKIHEGLERMRTLLERQVNLLEQMPGIKYYHGWAESAQLRALFRQEREVFYEVVVKEFEDYAGVFGGVTSVLHMQAKRTKDVLNAHITLLKRQTIADLKDSRRRSQRTLLLFIYVVGATRIVYNLKNQMVPTGLGMLERYLVKKKLQQLEATAKETEAAFGSITDASAEQAARALEQFVHGI